MSCRMHSSQIGFGVKQVSAFALAASLMALATSPVSAQEVSPEEEDEAPPTTQSMATADREANVIIVTAERRAQPLNRVGVSVAAVGAQELATFNVQQAQDLRRVVPGFQAIESASTGSPIYVLRGVGFDAPAPATSSPVGVYMDEVSVPYAYMSQGLVFDLERVEVLRGPQGTLYGRNTTGGLINLIAAPPTDTFEGALTAGYGNYNTWETEGYLSGPIADALTGRLSFRSWNREDGWQRSVTRPNDRLGELHRQSARIILEFEPDTIGRFTLTGNYWQIKGDTQAPQAVEFLRNAIPPSLVADVTASLIPNPTDANLADFTDPNRDLAVAEAGRRAGIGIQDRPPLKQNSDFYSLTFRTEIDVSDNATLHWLSNFSSLDYSTVRDFGGLQTESLTQKSSGSIDTLSQEIRLVGGADRFNWSVGGYIAFDETNQRDLGFVAELSTIVDGRAFLPVLNPLFGSPFTADELASAFRNYAARGESEVEVYALFANANFELSDQLSVKGGARYTYDKETGSSCALNVNDGQTPFITLLYPILTGNFALPRVEPNGCYTLTEDFSDFTLVQNAQSDENIAWRGGIDYTPNENILLYGLVSRGYKSGSFPVFAAANETQLRPVEPEQLTSYEIGAKLGLFDRRMQVNASAFYYDYKNRQTFGRVPDIVFGSLLRIVNIPSSEAYGGEVEATIRVHDYITARGAVAYLETEIKEFQGFDVRSQVGIPTDFAGDSLPFSPRIQASGSLIGDFPLTQALDLLASANVSHQSRSSNVLGREPGFDIDPYTVVGATLGLHARDDGWSVEVWADNLFDEYYFTSAQRGNETLLRYAGMPRTFGVRGTIQF